MNIHVVLQSAMYELRVYFYQNFKIVNLKKKQAIPCSRTNTIKI